MTAGTTVVLIDDPSRVGETTGQAQQRGPFTYIEVPFGPHEVKPVRAEFLQVFTGGEISTEERIRGGQWGKADDLRRLPTFQKLKCSREATPRANQAMARLADSPRWRRLGSRRSSRSSVGNGRVGRLLITFLLCQRGILRRPLLYLSHFFKVNRAEYLRSAHGRARERALGTMA